MERIVESERGDVQTLAQDCKTLRREAVSAREECEKAQWLKGQLEALVTQLQEDAGTNVHFEEFNIPFMMIANLRNQFLQKQITMATLSLNYI